MRKHTYSEGLGQLLFDSETVKITEDEVSCVDRRFSSPSVRVSHDEERKLRVHGVWSLRVFTGGVTRLLKRHGLVPSFSSVRGPPPSVCSLWTGATS